MTEKRETSLSKSVSDSTRNSDSEQNPNSYASLQKRIKNQLIIELQRSNILLTEESRKIWDDLFEGVLVKEHVVLSRVERNKLRDKFFNELVSSADSKIVISFDTEEHLTPRFLSDEISPYISAIEDIQHILDEIDGRQSQEVRIKSITQNSPISIGLDGVANAAHLIRDSIIPWRRKHDEIMAQLNEQEKLADIENKKAEILEKRSQSAKAREEARKLQLENEQLRLQLEREKVGLAIDILQKLKPNLSERERTEYLLRLVSPLETIIANRSEVSF